MATPAPEVPPPPPPRSGWRTWLPRVLVESALIVFSVLLALAVDQWRESSSQRQQAEAARREILAELQANQATVATSQRYHAALLDSLARYRSSDAAPLVGLFSRGFILPAQLSHTAWSSAAETGALAHMDYSTVLLFSRVYAQQDRYAEQSSSIGEIIYSALYHGGTEAIVQNHRNLAGIINTFRYREDQLLGLYAETLAASNVPPAP